VTATLQLDALPDWLASETASASGTVAVLAGHFAIFSAGGTARDLLDDGDAAPAGAGEMIEFTRRTWAAACEVAARHRDREFLFVPLVDDIQFLRPMTTDRSASERLAAALAADYLDRVPQLPGYHLRELGAHGLSADRVLRNSGQHWSFSERRLRIAAVHRLRQLLDGGASAPAGLFSSDNGATVTVTLPERGEHRLVQAGHTSCAGGYLELLATLRERGVRKLIAMVPMRCLGQVALGTTLAHHLLGTTHLSAISLGIPDRGTTGCATLVTGEP
jgi:hypothetical protein